MTDALILTALELEARGLAHQLELPRLTRFPFPVYERPGGSVRVAPVGLRAALLLERGPALAADLASPLVISAGTCGALDPALRVGDVVLPESVLGLDGERLNVTPGALARAVTLLGPEARSGELLLTTADVVPTPEAKAARFRATGAVAVDLESAVILAWASRHGCPSLVIRAVADTAQQRLPVELGGVVTPEGRLRPIRAAALFVTHPRTIPQALSLQRGTGRALRSVARVIAALAG